MINDFVSVIQWWSVLFVVGLFFLPLTFYLFKSFLDKGYIFSKVIGSLIISYIFFVLGILHIISFNKLQIVHLWLLLATIGITFNICIFRFSFSEFKKFLNLFIKKIPLFVALELLFFLALLSWSYVRAFQPDIIGLEKYMDFGFVNSILRSNSFPPTDIWFPPMSINYYYFGHLTTAVLTEISNLPSSITFNLMIVTLFAYTFTQAFSIGMNLVYISIISKNKKTKVNDSKRVQNLFWIILGGFLSAFLVSLGGTIHSLYSFFKPYNTANPVFFTNLAFSLQTFPNSYWYPNATRFIYNTIHEFPIYSFVVSDLHGHVLSIPIVLTILAFLAHIFLNKKIHIGEMIFLSFLLSSAYMTNVWDGAIYFLLTAIVFFYLEYKKVNKLTIDLFIGLFVYLFIIGVCFFIFSLPFNAFFKPFASNIGILCAPQFLVKLKSLGPLLFEDNHCQKSPIWQLFILYGFFYFWVISFIVYIKNNKLNSSDIFIFLLISLSTVLIIIPEFIYLKDIYPAHFRANTMFKLVYQSFIMLSLASGYIIIRLISNFEFRISNFLISCIGSIGLFLVFLYPYFAVSSYYGNLLIYKGLDGISYLKTKNPSDYETILWFNKTVKGQPVILEAQGDSYTDYERISANTGLPTVLGWIVHEWLWRKTYDVPAPRIAEVKTIYESQNIKQVKQLLKKYHVSFVVIGDLERQKYTALQEEKFKNLGSVVFESGKTKVYKL